MRGRRTGEHVTFIISLLIILGIFANLVINQIRNDSNDYLTFSVAIKWKDISEDDGRYIVPVEVINKSSKTANLLKLGIVAQNNDRKFNQTIELEYLTQDTPKKIFVILPFLPLKGKMKAAPLLYILD